MQRSRMINVCGKDSGLSRPCGSVERAWRVAIIAMVASSWPSMGVAEYLLRPGDVIEMSVVGAPDLRQSVTVNLDGEASFPLIGQIRVAGSPLSEVRAKVIQVLPTKFYHRRGSDGREYPIVITPEEINVAIAEYSPVYIDGDVTKPGAVSYRPGLTARQAVALAGGYDVMRLRGHDPFLETADFRAEYYSLWTKFAEEQIYISRLKAELGAQAKIDLQGLADTPLPAPVVSQIKDLESQLLDTRNADHQKEVDHLRRSLEQEDRRIQALTEEEQKQRAAARTEAEGYEQMQENFRKGAIPMMRLNDERRVAQLSATEALRTTVARGEVERERETVRRNLEKVEDERRAGLIKELKVAEADLQTDWSHLQAAGDKLMYSGLARSQLVRGRGGKPELKIFRDNAGVRRTFTADQDAELMPGDVVEVALPQNDFVDSTKR
jgi:polysaccharide biosynthesis/export protein